MIKNQVSWFQKYLSKHQFEFITWRYNSIEKAVEKKCRKNYSIAFNLMLWLMLTLLWLAIACQ